VRSLRVASIGVRSPSPIAMELSWAQRVDAGAARLKRAKFTKLTSETLAGAPGLHADAGFRRSPGR
jgi:hypothetical protein